MKCKSMGKNGKQHLHMVFRVVSLASVERDQHACIATTTKKVFIVRCVCCRCHILVYVEGAAGF